MKDLPQLARETAYRAQSEGKSINGIAQAVMQVVLERSAPAWQPIATCPQQEGCPYLVWVPPMTASHDGLIGIAMYCDGWRDALTNSPLNFGEPILWAEVRWPAQPAIAQPNSGGALAGDGSSTKGTDAGK